MKKVIKIALIVIFIIVLSNAVFYFKNQQTQQICLYKWQIVVRKDYSATDASDRIYSLSGEDLGSTKMNRKYVSCIF